MPAVRRNEQIAALNLINAKDGEKIFEIGTGGGYLTFPLARMVGLEGQVVTADIDEKGLRAVLATAKIQGLPIFIYHYQSDYFSSKKFAGLEHDPFDKIATLATYHHFDTRGDPASGFVNTGDHGRVALLREAFAMLRPGGVLVIVDVMHDTRTQKYFDAIDDAVHFHPIGHPHDFFPAAQLESELLHAGFAKVEVQIRDVPWRFATEADAMFFFHTFHQALCPAAESFRIARDILGFYKTGEYYEMGWQLGFAKAYKG